MKRFSQSTLPARKEHLDAVRAALRRKSPSSKRHLAATSGLSLNQTLCAIDSLMRSREVVHDPINDTFAIANSDEETHGSRERG
jgi:hypothetical protein